MQRLINLCVLPSLFLSFIFALAIVFSPDSEAQT